MNSSTISSNLARSSASRYLGVFALVVLVLGVITFWLVQPIAPQFTGNLSFDQKLLYLRQHPPLADMPLTLVVGSSMALNNLDTDILADEDGGPALNLGVWGMSLHDSGKLANQFEKLYRIDEIILAVQFFEMLDEPQTSFVISDDSLRTYLNRSRPLAGLFYRNFYESLKIRRDWHRKYDNPLSYTNLKFTVTGAVPLSLSHDAIAPERWTPSQKFSSACTNCMAEIDTLCRATRAKGLPFTTVMPPLTHWIKEKRLDVKAIYADRRERLHAAIAACNGAVFDVAVWADFDDSCFADFAHLNTLGMKYMTALFVEWRAGHLQPRSRPITCDGGLETSSQSTPDKLALPATAIAGSAGSRDLHR